MSVWYGILVVLMLKFQLCAHGEMPAAPAMLAKRFYITYSSNMTWK